MKEDFFKKWNLMTTEMQKSLQSMIELNAKTVQSFSYIKPGDLSGLKQPGDLLGKHIALTMENSQKILDYMHKSFQILESALVSASKEAKDNAVEAFTQVKTEFDPAAAPKKTRKPRAKAAPKEKKAKAADSAKKLAKAEAKKEAKPKKAVKAKVKASKPKAKSALKAAAKSNPSTADVKVEKVKQPVVAASMAEQENKKNSL